MAGEHGEVRVSAAAAEHRHVVAEALEIPGDTLAQGVEVHTFDDGEIADDEVAGLRRRGHDAEAAIAHHRGGDTERRRGRERCIPGHLRVVVRVNVDDARRQSEAVGIDGPGSRILDLADVGDAAILHRKIGAPGLVAQAVDDRGAANDQIDHHRLPPFSAP